MTLSPQVKKTINRKGKNTFIPYLTMIVYVTHSAIPVSNTVFQICLQLSEMWHKVICSEQTTRCGQETNQ